MIIAAAHFSLIITYHIVTVLCTVAMEKAEKIIRRLIAKLTMLLNKNHKLNKQ